MRLIKVRIEGKGLGLLQHRYTVATQQEAKGPKKKGQKMISDDVESYLYLDEDGKTVCQPATHIQGLMKSCGAKFQIPGQKKLTYKNIIGAGATQILPDMIAHEYQDWIVDERACIVNRGRIIRQRPYFPKWALSFDLIYDEEEIDEKTVYDILQYGAIRNGLGDYRPQKGGPFGKFIVTNFEAQKSDEVAT